jgi:hypothetical protein
MSPKRWGRKKKQQQIKQALKKKCNPRLFSMLTKNANKLQT